MRAGRLLPTVGPRFDEIDYGLTDIVALGYETGVRSGEQVAKGVIAVRIGPDMCMAIVAAPAGFPAVNRPANSPGTRA